MNPVVDGLIRLYMKIGGKSASTNLVVQMMQGYGQDASIILPSSLGSQRLTDSDVGASKLHSFLRHRGVLGG